MVQTLNLAELNNLSVDERIEIVQTIWDSISDQISALEPTDAQRHELERRLAAHKASPQDVVPWEQVKAQALARARR